MSALESLPRLGDRYAVRKLIGAGGMGRVYLAEDIKYNRSVAVKVLDPEYARVVGTHRFLREIQIAATLSHPNIVPLYDSGEVDGQLFYSMPYVEGESLRQLIDREGMLPTPQVIGWAVEVADALAFAHAHGIVHRDIKPENLLIQAGHLLIADFGIARAVDLAAEEYVTSEQIVLGTPAYMSPEQASRGKLDGRTDVYSLGCVVYEMLAGESPFGGSPQAIVARKIAGHYPSLRVVRPTVPRSLERGLARALSPIPADRFSDAHAFSKALREGAERDYRAVLLGLVALGLVGGTIALVLPHGPRARGAAALRPRVVVAMLENRTGEPSYDALSFMATDWVTEGLQRTSAVDVVPTPTALAATRYVRGLPGPDDPVRALALETGATLVVTGAIYRDHDSLEVQAQLANPEAGRLVGVVEPVRTAMARSTDALQTLRVRIMGLLALSLDDRVVVGEHPPTYAAYQAFSEGMDAYVRSDWAPALAAFERSHALDARFVLPLLYASFCHMNLRNRSQADSVLRVLARDRGRLSDIDREWLDYQRAELAGNRSGALAAIRRAAELTPGSKATYNLAVTAYEGRQPFTAESALERLSPDLGPMRGWLPYWDVLTEALHAQGKYGEELKAARETMERFPDQLVGYVSTARALAAEHKANELDHLWTAVGDKFNASPVELGTLAYEAGSELWAHGDSIDSRTWFGRAYSAFAARAQTPSEVNARWGEAQTSARLGRLDEALHFSEALAAQDPTHRDRYLGFLGVVAAQAGDGARARVLLDQLAMDTRPYTFGEPQFEAGRIAVALGDVGRATGLLVLAERQGYAYQMEFHQDPILARLRGTPIWGQLDAQRR